MECELAGRAEDDLVRNWKSTSGLRISGSIALAGALAVFAFRFPCATVFLDV